MSLLTKAWWAVTAAIILLFVSYATAAEKEKKNPVTQYWMSIATQNTSIPGMPQEELSGLGGMLLGKMAGIGPKRSLLLQLSSPKTFPAEPEASHDIPPGMNMGKTLPLSIPKREAPVRGGEPEEGKIEKPKVRMLMYWGCAETVQAGQPKVLDTEKMSMVDFGKAMMGRSGSAQSPPSPRAGWAYAEWPEKTSYQDIPKDSSLPGEHFIHGNFTPDIKFAIGERHDFMAPVELTTAEGGLTDSIKFQWKKIPTALGYFAMAMGYNEKTGETIIWSSSEVQEPGYGLMNYLAPADVGRFIKGKVIMGPEATTCSIPKGIFKEGKGAMLQFIGYGDELNISYPPKPKGSSKPHEYIWSLKLRGKSTGMLPLGQEEGTEKRATKGNRQEKDEQPVEGDRGNVVDKMKGTLDKMKGRFGF
jgi:hypothetical protein